MCAFSSGVSRMIICRSVRGVAELVSIPTQKWDGDTVFDAFQVRAHQVGG